MGLRQNKFRWIMLGIPFISILIFYFLIEMKISSETISDLINVPSQIRSYPLEKNLKINKRTGMFIWKTRVVGYYPSENGNSPRI